MGAKLNGREAGSINGKGYRNITIDGIKYQAHRLAIFYVTGEWPGLDTDHRNLIKSDNRYANIRRATRSQNLANRPVQRNNRAGAKGIRQMSSGSWQARITVDSKSKYLGSFASLNEAEAARNLAASSAYGEFAR